MNLARLIRFSFSAVLLLAPLVAPRAQNALEIIGLRHRTAEQVLPALQPLVEPGGTLSGQGGQLFVRTSPANLAELRRALEAIDRPARRLQISVRFDDSLQAADRRLGASGRIGTGGSNVEIRARDSAASAQERVDQRLQVLDGGRATVFTGEATSFGELATGFDVVPRVTGDAVQLDILASRQTGPASEAQVATTASGRLGEWLPLGAVVQQAARSDAGIASSASRERAETRRVWIKVETLP